ncbi:MAG: ABC transporter substrate-binding protein [Deltaproteobacteria bacterium]|nr:ABC transporter substrate-binding protein [Deltaproteobacteria bacterium]
MASRDGVLRKRRAARFGRAGIAIALALGILGAYLPGGPMETTRKILQSSNKIVTGPGTREQKLEQLKGLLRDFLDTDALGRQSMGKHLDGTTPEQQKRFFELFRDLFVRTYVQRLLLFDAPDFAYGKETVTGDTARIGTEIVTPNDRFAVDYALQKKPSGWQATDILIEDVSLAANFRSQFDQALAKSSFDELLGKLDRKLHGKKD